MINCAMKFKGLKLKVEDIDGRGIKAYWSSFGNIDKGGDMIDSTAFNKTIKERGVGGTNEIKFLYEHDKSIPLGAVKALEVDSFGLLATCEFLEKGFAPQAIEMVEKGVLNQSSIGYDVMDYAFQDTPEGKRYTLLKQIKLYEGSLVLWGMNPLTPIVDLKSEQDAIFALSQAQKLLTIGSLSDDLLSKAETIVNKITSELKAKKSKLTEEPEIDQTEKELISSLKNLTNQYV